MFLVNLDVVVVMNLLVYLLSELDGDGNRMGASFSRYAQTSLSIVMFLLQG